MVSPKAKFCRELVRPRAGGADTCRHENKFRTLLLTPNSDALDNSEGDKINQ